MCGVVDAPPPIGDCARPKVGAGGVDGAKGAGARDRQRRSAGPRGGVCAGARGRGIGVQVVAY